MNPALLGQMMGGTLPILAIAWGIRRIAGKKATDLRWGIISTLASGAIAYVLQSIGDGEGGLTDRLANVTTGSALVPVIGSTVIALALTFLWAAIKKPAP